MTNTTETDCPSHTEARERLEATDHDVCYRKGRLWAVKVYVPEHQHWRVYEGDEARTLLATPTQEGVGREELEGLAISIETMRQVYAAQLTEFDCELGDEDAGLVADVKANIDRILSLLLAPKPGEGLEAAVARVWAEESGDRSSAIGCVQAKPQQPAPGAPTLEEARAACRAAGDRVQAAANKLCQPAPGAPVAWVIFAANGNVRFWHRDEATARQKATELGKPLVPLYAGCAPGAPKGWHEVVAAAEAVVARWDTPLWKETEPTANVVNRLRNALAALILSAKPGGEELERAVFRLKTDPESHPVLKAMIDVRSRAAGDFTPAHSGQRGEDFDRGLLAAFDAAQDALVAALKDNGHG